MSLYLLLSVTQNMTSNGLCVLSCSEQERHMGSELVTHLEIFGQVLGPQLEF